jgi:hypothetical protein
MPVLNSFLARKEQPKRMAWNGHDSGLHSCFPPRNHSGFILPQPHTVSGTLGPTSVKRAPEKPKCFLFVPLQSVGWLDKLQRYAVKFACQEAVVDSRT